MRPDASVAATKHLDNAYRYWHRPFGRMINDATVLYRRRATGGLKDRELQTDSRGMREPKRLLAVRVPAGTPRLHDRTTKALSIEPDLSGRFAMCQHWPLYVFDDQRKLCVALDGALGKEERWLGRTTWSATTPCSPRRPS